MNALKDIAAFNCLEIIKENISKDIKKKKRKEKLIKTRNKKIK